MTMNPDLFFSLVANVPVLSFVALLCAAGLHTVGRLSDRHLVFALVAIVAVCALAERAALAPYVSSLPGPPVSGL